MAVAVTPNGQADAVQTIPLTSVDQLQTCFVLPLEEHMPFESFAAHLQQQQKGRPTYQSNGSCTFTPGSIQGQRQQQQQGKQSTDSWRDQASHGDGLTAKQSAQQSANCPSKLYPSLAPEIRCNLPTKACHGQESFGCPSSCAEQPDSRMTPSSQVQPSASHPQSLQPASSTSEGFKQFLPQQRCHAPSASAIDLTARECSLGMADSDPLWPTHCQQMQHLSRHEESAECSPETSSQGGVAWPSEVLYLQQQNSNLTNSEFSRLHQDIELDIAWAREVFGSSPDASNLWIGNDCSTTSFHKDHYENLFAVVAGEKHFMLLPPCDIWRLHMGQYPVAQIERSDQGELQTRLSDPPSVVKWTPIDPFTPASAAEKALHPLYYDGGLPGPFHVVVKPGDLLYLPSLWLHAVAQVADDENKVIGINFWYDMKFDHRYAHYNLVETLADDLAISNE